MVTHNRPEYTDMSLSTLCSRVHDKARIVIWDNASSEKTIRVLKKFESKSSIETIIYSKKNLKLREPTNWFWKNYSGADFFSKVDDDCLVPEHWCDILVKAHNDVKQAGILGCWRFFPEDFNEILAMKKIQTINGHQIMRNCWVEGSGYLMKGAVIRELGLIKKNESFTTYCLRAASKGYINGWYFPFLFQEHMDDPRAEHTLLKTDNDLSAHPPLTAKNFNVTTIDQWTDWLKDNALRLQIASLDPYDFIGLKAKIKNKFCNFLGIEYFPKVK